VGRHYELVSVLYRLLGAKVGKRVFWPGHQPIFTGEFDLLEIGDDVVFGSRSVVMCTTAYSCERVILCAGSNLSDNSIVLPGGTLGKNSVLGSNSICPENWYLPEGSVWVGNENCEPVLLDRGRESGLEIPAKTNELYKSGKHFPTAGDESTIRPFGKAFYLRQANYYVLPLTAIVAYTLFCKTLAVCVHTIPILGALHGAAAIWYGFPSDERDYSISISTSTMFFTVLCVFLGTNIIRILVWISIEMTAKWTLMGRRRPGQVRLM
jgi:hypothetical protein